MADAGPSPGGHQGADDETLRFGHAFTPWSGRLYWPEFQDSVLRYDPIDAMAVRFVHGGDRPGPVLLDE